MRNILDESYSLTPPISIGNYNSIADYNRLCDLDLDNTDSLRNHINLLRALSHGEFNNVFALVDGKKYFLKVAIKADENAGDIDDV